MEKCSRSGTEIQNTRIAGEEKSEKCRLQLFCDNYPKKKKLFCDKKKKKKTLVGFSTANMAANSLIFLLGWRLGIPEAIGAIKMKFDIFKN